MLRSPPSSYAYPDVGGGATPSDVQRTLSDISLRWMLREIVQSNCGIQFDHNAFVRAGIPLSILGVGANLEPSPSQRITEAKLNGDSSKDELSTVVAHIPLSPMGTDGGEAAKQEALDAVQPLHDELKIMPLWGILEVIPFLVSWQDETGAWHRAFRYVFFVYRCLLLEKHV